MMNYKNLCRTKSQKGNLEAVSSILNILREYSEQHPNKTFISILIHFLILPWFHVSETSQETLKRIVGKEFKGEE